MTRNTPHRFASAALRGAGVAAVFGVMLFSVAAVAQDKPNQAGYQPGMLDSVGRWFKDSFNGAKESLGGLGGRATDAAKEAADAAKDAADAAKEAAIKFPNSKMIDGRERCLVAENGAPDCRKAAEAVCRAKGFSSGSSLEIQSSRKCPARVWISGRQSEPGDCELQSFVTRAVCQ